MKDLVNKLLPHLHLFILAYGLYEGYLKYEGHLEKVAALDAKSVTLDGEIAINKSKVNEISQIMKKADEFKLRVEEVAKNIEAVHRQLPSETNDSQILTYINQEMGHLNIKDPNLTPGPESESTYYISKEYSFKAKGTFLQFLVFFERLGNASRVYNLKNLKMVVSNEQKKGRFQLVNGEGLIQAFRFNPKFKVDRGFDRPLAPGNPQ